MKTIVQQQKTQMRKGFYVIAALLHLFSGILLAQQAQFAPKAEGITMSYGIKKGDKWVLPPDYIKYVGFDKNGIGFVAKPGKAVDKNKQSTTMILWGVVNYTGKIIVETKYKEIRRFANGMAAIQTPGGKWGFIDMKGKEVIAPVYASVNDFDEIGTAVVATPHEVDVLRFVKIDKRGEVVRVYQNVAEVQDEIRREYAGTALGRSSANDAKTAVVDKDVATFNAVQKKAQKGDAEAMFRLGALHFKGVGTFKDMKEAYNWFVKADKKGSGEASVTLGQMYAAGIGVEKNMTVAFDYFKRAAERGIADGNYYLGTFYDEGIIVETNKATAIGYYRKAAEKGSLKGAYAMGYYHLKGYENIVPKDVATAMNYLVKAEAVYKKDPVYYQLLGRCFFEMDDFDTALKMLNRAVTLDPEFAPAYESMGEMYFTKGYKKKAAENYKKAAQLGNEQAIEWCKENNVDY